MENSYKDIISKKSEGKENENNMDSKYIGKKRKNKK